MGKYTVAGIRPDMDAVPPDIPVELISLMKAASGNSGIPGVFKKQKL